MGSRPQGNDGILYSFRATLLYFKGGVKRIIPCPQGNDGILYSICLLSQNLFQRGQEEKSLVRGETMASHKALCLPEVLF